MVDLSPALWLYAVVIILMIIFAVVSNMLVIYCVITCRDLQSVTHVLICNLAVSDTILAGFVMPQRVHDLFHDNDYFEGEVLCKVVNCVPIMAITCSSYTLVCVSFDRYLAVCRCHAPQISLQKLAKIIPVIWLCSLAVCTPTLMQYQVNQVGHEVALDGTNETTIDYMLSCDSQHMPPVYKITNAGVLLAVSYLIPVVLMSRNYIKVANFVWKRGTASTSRAFKNAKRLVQLLILVAAIFTITWLPFFVLLMYATISNQDTSIDAAGSTNLLLLALATFNTTYNIVLYVIFNPALRRAIKQVLHYGTSAPGGPGGLNRDETTDKGDNKRSRYPEESAVSKDNQLATIDPVPVETVSLNTSVSDVTLHFSTSQQPDRSPQLSPRSPIEKY